MKKYKINRFDLLIQKYSFHLKGEKRVYSGAKYETMWPCPRKQIQVTPDSISNMETISWSF